jgi:AraC-like DNA-binding protein
MEFAPVSFRRTREQIEQADPETYNVVILREGGLRRVDARGVTTYEPGQLHVNDSSSPFRLDAYGADTISCIGMELPRSVVPTLGEHASSVIGRPLSAREGLGGLLVTVLDQVLADHGSYRNTDAVPVEAMLRELLTGVFTNAVEDAEQYVPAEVHRRTLLLRMRTFIDQNLHLRDLGPRLLAEVHHVSVSHVHRVFGEDGTTVAGWIRARRLERAHRDLSDPAMRAVPVHHVAARWGFSHHAAFTRAFRAAYGVSPRDVRREALCGAGWSECQETEDSAPTTATALPATMVSRG